MIPVQQSNLELSIFKRSNYTDYILKLDTICELITNARHCINSCDIKSNPFALISMNSICSEKARQDAKLLEPCLVQVGSQINDQCVQICGDYEQLTNQLHTSKPEDENAVQQFNAQTNNACSILKCSARCAADQFNKQCGRLMNGQMAGDLIRDTVERVLSTHRMDLQVFGLMETVKKTTQPECNYLFTPEVLFNAHKDMISQQNTPVVEQSQRTQAIPQEQQIIPVVEQNQRTQAIPEDQQLKRVESQLQVRVLKKQLQVLNKQLELLGKQENKLETHNEMPRFMQSPPHFEVNDMF